MSETGRKMDVEDVLSSIRRLVSEEARGDEDAPQAMGNAVEDVEQPTEIKSEKLVLTPSLRVPEDEPKGPPTSDLEQRIADIETLVNADADTPASTVETREATSDPAAMMSALNLSMREFTPAEPGQSANQAEAPVAVEPLNDLAVDAESGPDLEPTAPEIAESEQETNPFHEADDAADDSADFPADGPFQHDFDAETPPAPIFAEAPEVDPDDAAVEIDEAEAMEQDDPETAAGFLNVEDELEDPEVEEPTSFDEPMLRPEPPLRAPVIDRHAETPDTADEPPQVAPVPPVSFEESIDFTASDRGGLVDEDMLREIVSEMVRSELQGELGDRITRNVRKLVRREIHRALASRDFE